MHRRGFTLIELLVVIAIIAILAAILFPVFAQAKMAAKKTQSISNAKQIVTAITMYSGDYDDVVPSGNPNDPNYAYWSWVMIGRATDNVPELGGATTSWYGWRYAIMPYVKNKDMFKDPLFQSQRMSGMWYGNLETYLRITRSYELNWSVMGTAADHYNGNSGARQAITLSSGPNVANNLFLMSWKYSHPFSVQQVAGGPDHMGEECGPAFSGTAIVSECFSTNGMPAITYSGLASCVFLDGHAKSLKPSVLFGKMEVPASFAPNTTSMIDWVGSNNPASVGLIYTQQDIQNMSGVAAQAYK